MFALTFADFSEEYNPDNACCFFKFGKSEKSIVVQGDPEIWNIFSPFEQTFEDWDIKVKIQMFRIYFCLTTHFFDSEKYTIDVANIFSVNHEEDFYNSHIWLGYGNKIIFGGRIDFLIKKRSVKI